MKNPITGSVSLLATLSLIAAGCDAPNQLAAPAEEVSAMKSTGAPTQFRAPVAFSFPAQCATFTMRIDGVGSFASTDWVNADGSTRSVFHVHQQNTFTNLTTLASVVADFKFSGETVVSADGNMISQTSNGVGLKVRREGTGSQIAYQMGHSVFTIDFSTSPPTFTSTFNGRFDGGAGPCVDLGDPAP